MSPPLQPRRRLSPVERRDLHGLEVRVSAGLRTFLDVGQALAEIRDRRLYAEHHDTFESYCRERWGMSKTHANRLIASAATMEMLDGVEARPSNEAQVRPLTLLPADQQAAAWERAVEAAGGPSRVTAAAVGRVVDEMLASGGATVHVRRPTTVVRFVDRDRLVKDLEAWCARHRIELPRRIRDFLRKY